LYTLKLLCEAVRALSPHASVTFTGKPDPVTGNGDLWIGSISVGDIIIAEHVGPLDEVGEELVKHLSKRSAAVLERLTKGGV